MTPTNGKGSKLRPIVDTDAYSKNWERIFGVDGDLVHDKCGTPECCQQCDTAIKDIDVKK
jgi:hypothetical protein